MAKGRKKVPSNPGRIQPFARRSKSREQSA
jgi:hypothetical protein